MERREIDHGRRISQITRENLKPAEFLQDLWGINLTI
jgi:hypothetical protein